MANFSIPEEIMRSDPAARLNYFRNRIVFHHNMTIVFDDLLKKICHPKKDSLLFIYGCAGIGKSRLCIEVVKEIVRLLRSTLLKNLAMIPIAHAELQAEKELTSWGEAYRTLLGVLHDILIDNKIKLPPRDNMLGLDIPPGDRPSTSKYFHCCISAIVHRKPIAILWDNANLLDTIPTRRKEWILNPLLGLCKYTPQVLLGTREMMSLRNLSGQAARRGRVIHFRRYFLCDQTDQDHFEDALGTFASYLPLQKQPDLIKLRDYIYDGCLGCMGILSDWLADALEVALDEGCPTITKDHLELTHIPDANLERLEKEAAEGEQMFSHAGSGRTESRQALRQAEKTLLKKSEKRSKEAANKDKPRQRRRGRRRPGTRNPARDPIGIDAFPQDMRDELKV